MPYLPFTGRPAYCRQQHHFVEEIFYSEQAFESCDHERPLQCRPYGPAFPSHSRHVAGAVEKSCREDLDEIQNYLISQGGRRLARYVLNEMREGFRLLASHREAGHFRKDLTHLPVKFWPVFSYLIVHDPAARPIVILRVLHGQRDVKTILGPGGR
jgi:antitoxin ParD1/3/4/toxin ParE1/3/4